ncbi:hypothetical protein M408DRAFT_287376 [Serendipita vermifera MAFF 305830]|uniref:Spindle assembly checkpoint component MAD1 n=1 Tax=Serendipita vermifera MAFF 305830 TaxID=933852 RepID=A0A0C3BEI9_SERVB|nr:hypothetical protein M408DRAFT_287376 [Serendipita vermifera MAFF 305830]
MDKRPPTRVPARSKLPTASSSQLVASTSTTKRTATTAQLDGEIEHALTRRKAKVEAFSASMAKNSLERRAVDAEQAKRTLEGELAKLKTEKDKVERDRRWFAEREKDIAEEREAERAAFERDKNELTTELSSMRTSMESLQRQFDSLSESHDVLENAATRANRACEETQRQLIAVQGENERNHAEAAKYRQLALGREQEIEELKQAVKHGSVSSHGQDSKEWEGLRSELVQQTEQMRRLEDVNAKMKAELLVLRERHANIEVLKEEKRILERRVRDTESIREQLGLMEAEVDALRQERANSTAHAQRATDIPVAVTQELAQLRMEHANILGQHQSMTDVLTRREEELRRAEELLATEQNQISLLKFRLQAEEAAHLRAEKRAKTAQQEVEMVNTLLERFTTQAEGDSTIPADVTEHSSMRIAALENMVEELKQANDALVAEMDEMGGDAAQVMSGPGRGSIAALKESLVHERRRVSEISEELETARKELVALEKKAEALDEELFRLKGEVGTGRHVPPGIRVLELADNPAAKWFGKREEDVQRLKKENEALRSMMGDGVARPTTGEASDRLVPKETLDVLIQEKSELEAIIKEKEKRLLRLQQIFSLKAEEFKTTVTSLLGWKFRFQQNGAVQLTSVYNPNALIVFSQPTKSKRAVGAGPLEGEDIKVQLIAETAPPEVMELYRTWVAGFGCVPGFLGSLSVQLFEASPEGIAKLRGQGA